MNHAACIRVRGVDAPMQCQRLAGALAAQLHTIRPNLGENLRLKEAQARFRGCDEKTIRQANADVSRRGMYIAALEERAAHTTDLLPQFTFVHRSVHKGKGFVEKVRRSKVTRFQGNVESAAAAEESA